MSAPNYKRTLRACYLGYVTQAIVNNLSPLFFVIFREDFGISLSLLGTLVLINFATQLLIDMLAAKFGNRFTYRQLIVTAHFTNVAGLVCLAFLPILLLGTASHSRRNNAYAEAYRHIRLVDNSSALGTYSAL